MKELFSALPHSPSLSLDCIKESETVTMVLKSGRYAKSRGQGYRGMFRDLAAPDGKCAGCL